MAAGNVSVVEVIKRLLFDGRSTDINLILKELVQNADDAQATRLAFGFHPGLPGTDHPLLGGPAFFAVNSGDFRPEHAAGVMSLAESPKIDDPASIGKFGIGLKSVFYYGEVFFYLCRSQDDLGQDVDPLADVFNPYFETFKNIRPHWDGFSLNDRTLMRGALAELGVFDGFCIWVPLRTSTSVLLGGKAIAIDPIRPGDQPEEFARHLCSPEVLDRLCRAMPLLRHVQSIEVFGVGSRHELRGDFTGHSLYPAVVGRHAFSGQVTMPTHAPYVFEVTEQQPDNPVFADIQAHPYWASSMRADHSEQVVDKTRAHASVTFARRPAATGSLKTQWAVFLPLGDLQAETCDGTTEFSLTMHGSFFVNADRRTILDWSNPPAEPSSSGELQTLWNAEVANSGIFPLLIPTLARFARHLDGREQEHLAAALAASPLFRTHRGVICESYQWVKAFTASTPQWRLMPAAQPLFELPFSEALTSWLPGVATLAGRGQLIVKGASHLLRSSVARWTPGDVETLFSGLKVDALLPQQARHLADILDVVLNRNTRPAVCQLLRRLLALPKDVLDDPEAREPFALLAAQLEVAERFVVPGNQSGDLRQALLTRQTVVVLVPAELMAEGADPGALSVADACTILGALRATFGKDSFRSRVLTAVLTEQKPSLLRTVDTLEMVELTGPDRQRRLVTPAVARHLVTGGHLYAQSAAPSLGSTPWGSLAQAVFPDHRLETTSSAVMRALDVPNLRTLGEDAVLSLLGRHLSLGGEQVRAPLLQALAPGLLKPASRDVILAVRYLIHGHREARTEPLLTPGKDSALHKLAVHLFAIRGEGWRIVSPSLAGQLNDHQKELLNVQPLDVEELRSDMNRTTGTLEIDPATFSKQERHGLIQTLPDDLLRRLPLFETVQGGFSALTSACFLPGETTFPEAVTETVVFLRNIPALAERLELLKLEPLTAEALLRHVLQGERPERHWQWILNQLDEATAPLKAATQRLLKSVAWLPAGEERFCSPAQVIDLPPLADWIAAFLNRAAGESVSPAHLSEAIGAAGLESLRQAKLLPEPSAAVDTLGRLLQSHGNGDYAVGDREAQGQPLPYATWCEVFSHVDQDVLPSRLLLERLNAWEGQEALAGQLYGLLKDSFQAERLPGILNGLGRRRKGQLKVRDELHLAYLGELVEHGAWAVAAPTLELPSAADTWRPAADLCFEAAGVADQDQLAEPWRAVLQSVARPVTVNAGDDQPGEELVTETGVQALTALFRRWEDQVDGVLIGAFLSVLGGHDTMRQAVAEFLGADEDPDLIRRRLVGAWREPRAFPRSFEHLVNRVWVVPTLSQDPVVTVTSLTGQPLRLQRRQAADLLAGQPLIEQMSGARFEFKVNLRINDLNPAGLGGDELSRSLLDATREVLKLVYHCAAENLDEVWKELDNTAQFDLALAQDLIVEDGMAYVSHQLRVPRGHPLRTMFEEWRRLRAREKKREQVNEPVGDLQKQLANLLRGFRTLLDDGDFETASGLLDGVRTRVLEAKYGPSSVPFEIFQNADDAALQLQVMRGDQPFTARPEENHFVLEQDDLGVTFMHWGRAINQYTLGTFTEPDYQLDLNNMLLLAGSDKGDETVSTTGRFGMGFKSSYLLTARPQIVSAKLAFEVSGGLYPRRLAPEVETAMRAQLRPYGEPVRGTAIRLRGAEPALLAGALQPFRAWAPVTLLFAKTLRRLTLDDVTLAWSAVPVTDTVSVQSLQPGHHLLSRALVIGLRRGTIMIPLEPAGVTALSDEVPTLWVLAPTQSRAKAGLAINAPFAVDIGRSEVTSQAKENLRLCDDLSTQLDTSLIELFDASLRWEDFRQTLHLHADVTTDTFWRSVWHLLAERQAEMPENVAGELVRRMFWRSGGARTLVQDRPVIPSGLSGPYDVLTSMSTLRFVVTGVLTQPSLLEAQISPDDLRPGTLVHENVWALLAGLLGSVSGQGVQVERLRLVDAVQRRFGPEPTIRHGDGPRAVPVPELLEAGDEETATLREYLNHFRFETMTGDFELARNLLILTGDPDDRSEEALRAAFAPESCVLHGDSRAEVQNLFKVCRRDLSRSVEPLIAWAADATSEVRRKAVLLYILNGNLSDALCSHPEFLALPWLRSLLTLTLFQQFDDDEKMRLAGSLGLGRHYRWQLMDHGATANQVDAVIRRSSDPRGDLERLYDQWEQCRSSLLRQFEEKRYPSFMHDGSNLKELWSDREQWMGLFLIGSYMTLGRIEKGTRGFLENAHRNGWMDTFCAETLDPDGWFAILDSFVDNEDAQYRAWINRFLAAYQISRHLGDYISLFQSASFASDPMTLSELLDVRKSHHYTGSGLDIPSIRSALGIGQHFVLRELVRRGVIENTLFDAQCYVPTATVRRRLYALGCDVPVDDWSVDTSSIIHDFLVSHLGKDRARFHGDFDLPFVLLP